MWRDTLGGWTFSQIFSSLALTVWDLWYYEDLEKKAHSILNQWMNDEAVYRTAPATPGLLKKYEMFFVEDFNVYKLYWV